MEPSTYPGSIDPAMHQPPFWHLARRTTPLFFAPKKTVPTAQEVVCLLKLWRAFYVMRRRLCPDPSQWHAFTLNCFRRFLIFVSAVKLHMTTHDSLYHVMPPLDICWVWHSMLLSPALCYETFARAGFVRFMYLPFPLAAVGEAIDNSTFSFCPDRLARGNFEKIIAAYGFTMAYDMGQFNPKAITYPLYCPASHRHLGNVSLALLASPAMAWHSVEGWITHQTLWRRQKDAENLMNFFASMPAVEEWPAFSATPLGPGGFTPPVHLTILPDCVALLGNWVDILVHNPIAFVIDRCDWLYLPLLEGRLAIAAHRYEKFWSLASRSSPLRLVPTLDIRLVWYAHLASFGEYADYSMYKVKQVVVPPEAGEQTTSNLHETAKEYRLLFGLSYCECDCWFCQRYNGHKKRLAKRVYTSPGDYRVSGDYAYRKMAVHGGSFTCARHLFELLLPTIEEEAEEVELEEAGDPCLEYVGLLNPTMDFVEVPC